MMVSMETYLLRFKRRTEKFLEVPGVRAAGTGVAYLGGGALLSSLRVWGQMQPVTMGLIVGSTGWRCICAALGSAVGYRLFWGAEGYQGMAWCAGAMLLTFLMPLMDNGARLRDRLAVGSACLVAGSGLIFQILSGATAPTVFLMRIVLGWGSAMLGEAVLSGRERMFRWLGGGVAAMALAGIHPMAGYGAAGLSVGAGSLPGAVLAGLGADLGAAGKISMTAGACLSFFLQRVPIREVWRRLAAPGAACGLLMILQQTWEPGMLLAVCIGGAVGAVIPWHISPVQRQGSVGGVQVRLEQTARVLNQFQRQLLEYAPPAPDEETVLEQLKWNTCAQCAVRDGCLEQKRMHVGLLTTEEAFACRKAEQTSAELRRSREQLRRMKATRAIREEYRMALVQQYGFLADAMHSLSDRLTDRFRYPAARFRVQVSSRSRSRELADGDRVAAFPGIDCRYYVVLCDGMGTGLGAAEESRQATDLIREMLTAGLPPETALGSMNSQLALMDRGGAVTVDLAEIRLDSGKVWIYKWGAGPSWLLRRKRGSQLGASGPPPGMGVSRGRENVTHTYLGKGEVLILASDGICGEKAASWAATAGSMETGELARRILEDGGSGEDDATVVAIRLVKRER